jgi:hypothetical protein
MWRAPNSGSRAVRYSLIEIEMMSHTFLFLFYRRRFAPRRVGVPLMALDTRPIKVSRGESNIAYCQAYLIAVCLVQIICSV